MTEEEIQAILISVSQMLTLIDTGDLQKHVEDCKRSLSRASSIGPILDPTGYRYSSQTGLMSDAKNQLAIAEALLAARRAIDTRERHCNMLRHGGDE